MCTLVKKTVVFNIVCYCLSVLFAPFLPGRVYATVQVGVFNYMHKTAFMFASVYYFTAVHAAYDHVSLEGLG
jgi:hypothetical protein